jgi:hypothetical protein
MKASYLSVIIFFISFSISAQSLDNQLFDLCGVAFEKIETAKGFESSYLLKVKQPLDHNDETKGYFYQKVYLNHRGDSLPTVLVTEGYNRNTNRIYEISDFINGNQVTVEHRYFGKSMPDSLDYTYLTFEQATADLHHVNQLVRNIYKGKYLATGISKGGTTTIFYRYFYPNDVDVSMPYVAPLNHELEEQRIYKFLNNVGTKQCRSDVLAFQKRILTNRAYNLERLSWFVKGRDLKFDYLNMEQAFEYAVLEYPFSLWQWGTDCTIVPGAEATKNEDLDHLLEVSGLDFFADAAMEAYASHYYQSGTQMGYYGYEAKPFKGLLPALGDDNNPSAVFAPGKMKIKWDGELTNKAVDWIEKEGNNFIYINGLNDTWSATRVPISKKVNSIWFDLEDQSHGSARITNFSNVQKELLKKTLNEWLDLEL